jgi:hypothetical protein
MIIYSFDCGSVNMGVCIIEYNIDVNKINEIINKFNLYQNKKKCDDIKKENTEMINIINEISNLLNNIIKIIYIDLVKLINKVDKNNKKIVSSRLKFYLELLDNNFPKPDKVLIESQFLASSLSCLISHQIQYHYDISNKDIELLNKNYNLKLHSIKNKNIDVVIVGPSLKNSIDFDKKNSYANLQLTSFNNYQVNKKHSISQFMYLIDLFDQKKCIKNFNKKLADIADAYMMTINYIFKYDL